MSHCIQQQPNHRSAFQHRQRLLRTTQAQVQHGHQLNSQLYGGPLLVQLLNGQSCGGAHHRAQLRNGLVFGGIRQQLQQPRHISPGMYFR